MIFDSFNAEIKAYRLYKSPVMLSKQRKEVIASKDIFLEFGIRVYGKKVPYKDYDDRDIAHYYKNYNDIIFVYESNEEIKRFIKKNDPMNGLNTNTENSLMLEM
ncbi:hypothetical protein CQA53_09525 [Helicobacter didelphidarum]|uniref:Uncharacterized protein n=1 Tax=Helicobacter didelphidarum TaxID=2040648 RepID=A0A3D8IAB0_9HELI|nr:hypothetical protein [Helicobacter didelphidarum]RDU62113.1 hypothetical protein CQA53_09525 [Helicobacter didelphidarum]